MGNDIDFGEELEFSVTNHCLLDLVIKYSILKSHFRNYAEKFCAARTYYLLHNSSYAKFNLIQI